MQVGRLRVYDKVNGKRPSGPLRFPGEERGPKVRMADDERLRIMEARATLKPDGGRKSWELIAEETHHSNATVLDVNKWFQNLDKESLLNLPDPLRKLREDYLEVLGSLSPNAAYAMARCGKDDHS